VFASGAQPFLEGTRNASCTPTYMHPQTPEIALALIHKVYGAGLEKLCLPAALPSASTTDDGGRKSKKKKRSMHLFRLPVAFAEPCYLRD
jgi:hypothetical protein